MTAVPCVLAQVDKLVEYLHSGRAFGELVTYCYVVEFQKRGNPHIHMVVRLKDGPQSDVDYDKYVTARLPRGPPPGDTSKEGAPCFVKGCRCRDHKEADEFDKDCDPVYWHSVLKQMVHLCDETSPCRDSATLKCKSRYDEQKYNEVTTHALRSRPAYKRLPPPPAGNGRLAYKRHGGSGSPWSTNRVTDADVVPHNPMLLLLPVGAKVTEVTENCQYESLSPEVRRQLANVNVRDAAGLAAKFAGMARDGTMDRSAPKLKFVEHAGDEEDSWHANVEISSNPTSNIKYLYLYFCKGEDRLVISVRRKQQERQKDHNPNDECQRHLNGQHHSPESSVWRLLSLPMHGQSHRCEQLHLVFPGQQHIRFDPNSSSANVQTAADAKQQKNHTQGFFNLNQREAMLRFPVDGHDVLPALSERPSSALSLTVDSQWSDEAVNVHLHGLVKRGRGSRTGAPLRLEEYLGSIRFDRGTRILHPSASALKYEDVPIYYTWTQKTGVWERRSRPHKEENLVTRISVVQPAAGDVFYMRLRLLYASAGCQSYEELRTVASAEGSSRLCDTFKEACIADKTVHDDSEWDEAMADGESLRSAGMLRSLFVQILMNCEPHEPGKLWERYKEAMAADIALRNGRGDAPSASDENQALREVRNELQAYPAFKSLKACGLPEIDDGDVPASEEVSEIRLERLLHENKEEQLQEMATSRIEQSNEGQLRVWRVIKKDIQEVIGELDRGDAPTRARTHFIYARGGFGKTWLDEIILYFTRGQGHLALGMASSGIAALLLEGARTVHSRLKVPLEVDDESMCSFSPNSATAALVRRAAVLLWDECTMLSNEILQCIDRTLRDILKVDLPFGGKLFIFTGDWAQTLPVTKGRHSAYLHTHLCSPLWQSVRQHRLTVNERVRQAELRCPAEAAAFHNWSEFLQKIGAGKIGEKVVRGPNGSDATAHDCVRCVKLPPKIVFRVNEEPSNDLDAFLDYYYPNLESRYLEPGYLAERTILAPKNDDVADINARVLERMPGRAITKLSADSTFENQSGLWSTDILNGMRANGMPEHRLELKIGCMLILLRNIAPAKGLCNGTRLTLLKVKENVLVCAIQTGKFKTQRVCLTRVRLHSKKGEFACTLIRHQYPVRLAFGMTINKSVGACVAPRPLQRPSCPCSPTSACAPTAARANPRERRPVPAAPRVLARPAVCGALKGG